MTLTDEELRTLVARRITRAPEELTSQEIEDRWINRFESLRASSPSPPPRRYRSLVAATAVVVTLAALGGGMLLLSSRRTTFNDQPGTVEVAGAKVGRYFVPANLPDDYRLLSVVEHAGDPAEARPASALYRNDSNGARVLLTVGTPGGRWGSGARSAELTNGTALWSELPDVNRTGPGAEFQIDFGNSIVDGQVRGLSGEEQLLSILEAVQLAGPDAIPALDDTAFTMVTSAPRVPNAVVAEWTAHFGEPGAYLGTSDIEVTVRRMRQPIDIALDVGTWDDYVDIDGRTIYRGYMNSSPIWYPDDNTKVTLQSYGALATPIEQLIATLTEVDDTTFEELVDGIEDTALDLAVGETVTFGSGVEAHLLGDRVDPRGICLVVDDIRRCDLALMARSGYTYDDDIASSATDLLVAGTWFTVGFQVHPTPEFTPADPPSDAEAIDLDDRTWYLIEHPAHVLVSEPSWFGSTIRPAR